VKVERKGKFVNCKMANQLGSYYSAITNYSSTDDEIFETKVSINPPFLHDSGITPIEIKGTEVLEISIQFEPESPVNPIEEDSVLL
jgi:hypothetical protein